LELIRRKNSFLELGQRLKILDNSLFDSIINKASTKNPWFTKENIQLSFKGLINYLEKDKIDTWLDRYEFVKISPKRVGVVLAGNIPLVGVHDLICILISGHKLIAKLSNQDDVLIPFIIDVLCEIEPEFKKDIVFVDQLKDIDAVIATGSDNSSRYFDYYFSKYPNIIRKNRTSVAILDGNESCEELYSLGHDIFTYFGLGCRNVSKLYLPEGKEIKDLIPYFDSYKHLHDHTKYSNNYYYNKSILLVNQYKHLDSGFALFHESEALSSPISMIYYEYYKDIKQVKSILNPLRNKVQCLVTNIDDIENRIQFGEAQRPELRDYADNVDTMKFLLKL